VLPTGGTARSTGGLSVYTFLRVRTWLRIDDRAGARPLIEDAVWLAALRDSRRMRARRNEGRFSGNGFRSEEMRLFLLIATLTLAQAQPGNGQAPFTCWIRGSAISWPSGRVRWIRSRRRSAADDEAVLQPPVSARPQDHGRAGPFDQPWRLGANEATSISVPFPAEIAGVRVKPGTYTLYAIPVLRSGRSSSTAPCSAGAFRSIAKCAREMRAPAR